MTTGRILRRIGPGFVLGYQVILMLASLGLLLWLTSAPGRAPSFSFDKVVPLWVPFGGWLGGITISIVGVATHTHDWNRQKYAYWHLARPLLGMLTGTVAVLIVLFVIKGVTDSPIPAGDETYEPSGIAVLFVIAFVVGFREETFRALIKRVLDVILATGDKPAEQRVALVPAYLELTAQRGASVTRTVTLVNTTKDTFDLSGAMPVFDPEVIGLAVTLPDAGPVGPGQSALLTLTWQPIAASVSTETSLVIEVGGYRLTSVVRLTVVT